MSDYHRSIGSFLPQSIAEIKPRLAFHLRRLKIEKDTLSEPSSLTTKENVHSVFLVRQLEIKEQDVISIVDKILLCRKCRYFRNSFFASSVLSGYFDALAKKIALFLFVKFKRRLDMNSLVLEVQN